MQILDAYGQVVNTDDLVSTRASGRPPAVTVQADGANVFLSGLQTGDFQAGLATLRGLRLVAEPGAYNLRLLSDDTAPASVRARPHP